MASLFVAHIAWLNVISIFTELRILYDDRLLSGMHRNRVLRVLPEIIADLYPEQAAR